MADPANASTLAGADAVDGSVLEQLGIEQFSVPLTTVTASESPYKTQGESRIAVDTSDGAVRVVLSSEDADSGHILKIVDNGLNADVNPITVEVEGGNGEVINPGGVTSAQISVRGGCLELENIGGDWYSDRNAQRNVMDAVRASIGQVVGVAYPSAAQTISHATVTKVQLGATEEEDTDVLVADLTNNYFTVQEPGVYAVTPIIRWSNSPDWTTGDSANAAPYVNGARAVYGSQKKVGVDSEIKTTPLIARFAAGDTIAMSAYQTSGFAMDVEAGAKKTRLQIARLG